MSSILRNKLNWLLKVYLKALINQYRALFSNILFIYSTFMDTSEYKNPLCNFTSICMIWHNIYVIERYLSYLHVLFYTPLDFIIIPFIVWIKNKVYYRLNFNALHYSSV